ncbi:MAG: tryptophan synthase subunit alpha [Acidiferrobacteraceae bacterium]|jgi:tryptophan synthase alpha chain|nr:tryptophan synthase subunit alpha [Acidiferrobacteraceae bacterium]MDP6552406.1 tryptophan synthase subunit alpha [Arenicellales bacterium]MDP6790306.1 tryptophan synthase subunit alpha [Arenicellales bacterium]MDP6918220.1 tryptophan synthase subunit alpha [Arenicellales bacterium]|tara:strand:+ start:78074 stop:78898 length:825 start_codon:yes stop_codon:yes gene_type:complete
MSRGDRVDLAFKRLSDEGRAGLVTFITAGDPDLETSQNLMEGLADSGADIIELGMPFSDPMADGPAIQAANLRALANGASLRRTLDMVARFRRSNDQTPVILMGYFNPIYQYGPTRFVTDAVESGVDGLILVDLPPEEDDELCDPARTAGLHWVRLVTPTSDEKRLKSVLKNASGFVYYVSIAGITGTRSASVSAVGDAVARLRSHTGLPIAVGFGINTPEQVHDTVEVADGAVVGSAIIREIEKNLDETGAARPELLENVSSLVRTLAEGARN